MNPNIGLNEKQRTTAASLLRGLLADEMVLYTKTRNAHWNVTGPHFHALHKLFEEQYEELAERIDELAERIRSLGPHAPGTLAEFLKETRLKEVPGEYPSDQGWIRALVLDHEAIIQWLRADAAATNELGDAGTSDFLTGLMEAHEKTAWMLRANFDK